MSEAKEPQNADGSDSPTTGSEPTATSGADSELLGAITAQEFLKLQSAAAECESLREQLLRSQADFQNYRRRTDRDVDERAKRRSEALLSALLSGIDELDRALLSFASASPDQFASGVRLIREILFSVVQREGVKEIPSVGEVFDPKLHEALTSIPSKDQAPGTIIMEQRRGYVWNDRVLRPSQVVIAAAPPADSPKLNSDANPSS